MNDMLIGKLEETTLLRRYKQIVFSRRLGLTTGKTNKKKPYVISRQWFGVYLLQLEKFEGRCSVIVTDESAGYGKKIATAAGLDATSAEIIFNNAKDILRNVVTTAK